MDTELQPSGAPWAIRRQAPPAGRDRRVPGVQVVRSDKPVELFLRQGPVAAHVVTFLSTAALTLPIVLADLGDAVPIAVTRVEPSWFTPATTAHAREFVTRIADEAPVRTELESA